MDRRCLFRVHKFMLTQHSLPFAEMLKKEALLSVLETLDGLPIVLLPEPASEIHKLLCCLYNALNGGLSTTRNGPITRYDWLLRICSKYKILPLHKRIVAQLKAEWPATLPAWDAREAHIAALLQQHIAAGPPGRVHDMYLDDRLAEPVLTIHTARALSLPQLLPAAFYDLARRDPRADWDALHTGRRGARAARERAPPRRRGAERAVGRAVCARSARACCAQRDPRYARARGVGDDEEGADPPCCLRRSAQGCVGAFERAGGGLSGPSLRGAMGMPIHHQGRDVQEL
ncbi:hypothetical protein B0H14DRAFT_2604346 [Mycena olivaceomarginata]|nr:hypothetical protein B0H14DRAFT_2604346 [Mycena olivaceomarginata]